MNVKRLLASAVIFVASEIIAAQPVTDPQPASSLLSPLGIQLEEWVRIPDSPVNGNAPRLNLLRQIEDGRFFVIDQRGYLYVIEPETHETTLYLNIRDQVPDFDWITSDASQTGSTYFAFHPEFSDNGIFYTVQSVRIAGSTQPSFPVKRPIPGSGSQSLNPSHHETLIRWQADDPTANSFHGTHYEIIRFEQPYADHNVGEIAFNPHSLPGDSDYGILYIATADGGWVYRQVSPDPQRNAQDLMSPLGKILRIDPEGNNSSNGKYGIPTDNPFLDNPDALDEIYAYGLRNPHRINWDAFTGKMYAYDIGGEFIEEINHIVPGGNYGWNEREGTYLQIDELIYPLPPEDEEPYLYPVAQYTHNDRNGAISGGFVYRGSKMPELWGHFIYADFTNRNEVFHTPASGIANLQNRELLPVYQLDVFNESGELSSLSQIIRSTASGRSDIRISEDNDQNLYALNKHNGWIYRILGSQINPPATISPSIIRMPANDSQFQVSVFFKNDAEGFWSVESHDLRLNSSSNSFGKGPVVLDFEFLSTEDNSNAIVYINSHPVKIQLAPAKHDQYWLYDPENGWMWLKPDLFPWAWFAEFEKWATIITTVD